MQNITNNIVNIHPEHFPVLSSSNQSTSIGITSGAPTSSFSERSQNFSFASTYNKANSSNTTKNNTTVNRSSPTSIFHFKPISSFTVLKNDELSLSSSLDTRKPNAIVRPIRRPAFNRPTQLSAPSSPATPPTFLEDDNDSNSNFQTSQHQALLPSVTRPIQIELEVGIFTEELNRKLNYLHQKKHSGAWTKSGSSSRHGSTRESLNNRPLFITTVPTGVFLPPARELPIPTFLKRRVYNYSSHPVVLNNLTSPKDKPNRNPAPINAIDKGFTTKASHISSPSLIGSVHLTKEQFQQQLQQRRTKRETPVEPYKNVMYDRRVVRGSNFGTSPLLADYDPFDKAAELRRRHALRKKTVSRNQRNILGTPPPVAGRRHEVIQTEKYLEELVQRPPEFSVDTQTDLFLERPPIPPYIPAKVGVDVGTEIADGELFHFDAEAQPIIDILVDACIEQSMLEVAHEQEIEALRRKQEEFIAQREAELAELRRLEAEEIRLQAEKERRLRQDTIAKELDKEMQMGVTAAKLLQGHIAGLLPEVLENLEPATDAAKKEHLMKTICPWLTVEVAEEVGHIVDSREILTVIIQEIIKQRAEVYAGYKDESPADELQLLQDAEDGEGAEEQIPESCVFESVDSDPCPPKEC